MYEPRPIFRAGTLTYLFTALKPSCTAGRSPWTHSGYARPSPQATGPESEAPAPVPWPLLPPAGTGELSPTLDVSFATTIAAPLTSPLHR